jgi:septum formation protein
MAEPLILASGSPRRRQLLEMLGIPVTVIPSNVPEVHVPGEAPAAYAERLARDKATSVKGALVLGADTTVVLDDHLLEKPGDPEDAVRMLRLLQGRTHEVVTAVALVSNGSVRQATDTRGVVTADQKPDQPRPAAARISPASGISTIRLR